MNTVRVFKSLGPVDVRGVVRDPMLRWIVMLAPVICLVFRFGLPIAERWLMEAGGYDIVPYRGLVVSFMSVITAALVGTVVGFLLLDQRDDDTLAAMLVTPLSLESYLAYRLAVPLVLSTLLTMAVLPLVGLVKMSLPQVVLASLCAAPVAPLYALVIGTFASNKVQGFALAKFLGVFMIPTIVAYFAPMPWQMLFGLVPIFWPVKVFWTFHAGGPDALAAGMAITAAGIVVQSMMIWLLARRFAIVIRR